MGRSFSLLAVIGSIVLAIGCSSSDDGLGSGLRRNTPRGSTPESGGTTGEPAASDGCNAESQGGVKELSIDVKGSKRTYVLSVPSGSKEPLPLVFAFHGSGGTGENLRSYIGFKKIAEDKAIFVYPDGEGNQWDLDTPTASNKDVAFFDALTAEIQSKHCVDQKRVFATGFSNGAYFVNQLGCRRGSDVLRAIAPHAGGGPFGSGGDYDANGNLKCAGKPPAVMVFHGTDDGAVSLSEGEKSVQHWRTADGCSTQSAPRSPSPCIAYQSCKAPVVFCKLPGQGHDVWSQGAQATWDFFSSF